MDGGFKKFWSRKKTSNNTDPQSHSRKLSSSNGANIQSTVSMVKDGKPSANLELPFSKDKRSMSRTSTEEYTRTKSGHRIQPMLVGISRPDGVKPRPGTADSLQTAVQNAADSVVRPPSNVSATQSIPVQRAKPVSRHVDIFSVASSVPSYRSRYNEDIAERNLDTYRLVLENTPYVYDPSSKYQEEVAIRNALLPYKSRTSTDTLRKSVDHERTTSIASKSIRSAISPQPNGVPSYQPSYDLTSPGQSVPRERPVYYWRQYSQRSQDGAQLSSIPQENAEEDIFANDEGLLAVYPPTRNEISNGNGRDSRMQTITEGQVADTRPSTATKSATPRNSAQSSHNLFTDYKVSALEYGSRPSTSRSTQGDRGFDSRTVGDVATGLPASHSTASSIVKTGVPPKRTVMDLTIDDSDIFSSASSAYAYSQDSPIVEQAKSDAFKKVMADQIHTEERRSSKGLTSLPEHTAQALENVRAEVEAEADPFTIRISETKQTQPSEARSSSFSPINTVASWSPRSSAYVTQSVEPTSVSARVAAALETSRAIARDPPTPTSNPRQKEPLTVKTRVATLENSNINSVSTPKARTETTSLQPVQSGQSTQSSSNSRIEPTQSATIKTPTAKPSAAKSSAPSIYQTPDSIKSADYIDPSGAFGVRTRDFALSPQKSPSTLQNETIPKPTAQTQPNTTAKLESKGKSVKSRSKQSTPAQSKPKDAGFDEEAFKRKQAEARAALERLQRSLSEDFITLPDRDSVKNRKGKQAETQPRLVAPTLILPHESKGIVTTISRTESERPPPSSFRTARAEQPTSSLTLNSRSLSNGTRSSQRAPAPSQLKHVEPGINPIDEGMLSPALLQALHMTAKAPRSPGEISLSSFPVPSSSRPPSQPDVPASLHSHNNSLVGMMKRRNSTKSQGSASSAFSIPYHMVPGRTSSVRDPVPEEGDMVWA